MSLVDKAKDLAEQATEKAGEVADVAKEKAAGALDKATDAAAHGVEKVTETIDSMTGGLFEEKLEGTSKKVAETLRHVGDSPDEPS